MPVVLEHHDRLDRAYDAAAFLEHAGARATPAKYLKSGIIFSQGSRAGTVFYLQQGSIKLSVVSKQGKEAVIAILPAESFFGEGCLAGQRVYPATATALASCRVLAFKKKQVLAAIRKYPDFAEFFIAYLLQRNARVEEDLVDQLFHSSEKRLARVLLLLAHFDEEKPLHDTVPNVSQETLARMIGTTRSRVNFFMNKFRRLGFIDYKDGLRVYPSLLTKVLNG